MSKVASKRYYSSFKADSAHSFIISSWKARNDSKNVSAALNPLLHDSESVESDRKALARPSSSRESPRKIVLESKGNAARPPWNGPCKECYCHKTRISPQLFSAPLNGPNDEDSQDVEGRCKMHDDVKATRADAGKSYCSHDFSHKVKKVVTYRPRSSFLRSLQDEARSKCTCLDGGVATTEPFKLEYTEDRANYENNRPLSCYEKDYSQELRELHSSADANDRDRNKCASLPNDGSITDGERKIRDEPSDVMDLRDFRDRNFFDCFSTGARKSNVPEHTCSHKFRINDRLFPMPLNADAYGVSRCEICDEPIGDYDGGAKGPPSKSASTRNLRKRYERNVMPTYVNFATKNERIELEIPDERIAKELLSLNVRPHVLEPLNTFALRYQKGVLK